MTANRYWRGIVVCACTLLLVVLAPARPTHAQETATQTSAGWMPVTPMPDSYPFAEPPIMAVDENRTVHAFVTMPLSFDPADSDYVERVIYYRQWTLEGGWTEPLDILFSPIARQARVKGVVLDKAGILHLLFFGGDDNGANMYYSWAPAVDAYSAQAWSQPLLVGPAAIAPDVAGIAGGGENQLVVLYSGNLGEGKSLYAVYSDDAGVTWSEPQLLYSTYSLQSQVFFFDIFSGESGTLHAVWNTVDKEGQNVAGFYSQLKDITSRQWTEPHVIAESVELGFAAPTVAEYNGEVMIIYNNGIEGEVAPVMWFVRSSNKGETFSPPIRPFPDHIGRNGPASFVVDSKNRLHAFWAQRIGAGLDGKIDLHGMWHSIWDGQSWGPVRPIETGAPSDSFDPYDATAVTVQGNTILLTYRTDPGRKISNSWWTYTVLNDAPELPVRPLPVPLGSVTGGRQSPDQPAVPSLFAAISQLTTSVVTATVDTVTEPVAAAAPLPTPAPQFSREPGVVSAGPGGPLLGAIIPTVLFVAGALILGSLSRRNP